MCDETVRRHGAVPNWATCLIAGNEQLTADTVYLTVEAPAVAAAASAGQFVHIGVAEREASDPFLRRPISLAAIDPARGTIGLVVRAIGRGTRQLAALQRGARADILGPVGRGFPETYAGRVILVGGGVGAAPLLPLAAKLSAGCDSHLAQTKMLFLAGARTAAELWVPRLAERHGVPLLFSTDDGSAGHPGLVTDLLQAELTAGQVASICACGPQPMLRAVAHQAARSGIPCYVSLEQRMGCGIGACLGCAWPLTERAGGGYTRVCVDGPVFAATEVIL